MSPEDRRAALIAATVPLLLQHGVAVSTRQIAEAAGVAEGTIFNVFPDKVSLLRATMLEVLDPEPMRIALTNLMAIADLRVRLTATVDLLCQRFAANQPLIHAARTLGAGGDPDGLKEFCERLMAARREGVATVASVFEPDRANLRSDPVSAARLLFLLVMANVHSRESEPNGLNEMDSDDIVSLLLDGLLIKTSTTSTGDPD
jgi:AcrR family transcriptional regulator